MSDCNLPRAEQYKAKRAVNWPVYPDHRRVLDHKDIDAVIVGVGDFQRVLPCIEACLAGKDVYAEKPLTLSVREGRSLRWNPATGSGIPRKASPRSTGRQARMSSKEPLLSAKASISTPTARAWATQRFASGVPGLQSRWKPVLSFPPPLPATMVGSRS